MHQSQYWRSFPMGRKSAALGVPLCNTACRNHHAEGRNEGWYARQGDQSAIYDTGDQAEADTDQDRYDRWQVCQTRVDGTSKITRLRKTHGNHCSHRDDGARAEIDTAGDDDLGYSDGDDADDGDWRIMMVRRWGLPRSFALDEPP